jgi:hypothetical protein
MMGFLFKKKDVPSELPDLISDEFTGQLKKELDSIKEFSESRESAQSKFANSQPSTPKTSSITSKPSVKSLSADLGSSQSSEFSAIKKFPSLDGDEPSYFKELIKGVMDESGSGDLKKLDSWCKNKSGSGDIVGQMKSYWDKQAPEKILSTFGGETKERLLAQVEKLHGLEKDWQASYLTLMECEEKIREEEKQLKEALAQFIDLYKRTSKRKHR